MQPKDFVSLLRPIHWVKNVFVFAPLLFAGRTLQFNAWAEGTLAFAAFCLLSSGAYAFNDAADAARDRAHPRKRDRPVAQGRIGRGVAVGTGILFVVGGTGLSLLLAPLLAMVALAYVLLNVLYTFVLKRIMLLDVACIAAGFVLRAYGGGVAVGVKVSFWLLACTFVLCLFLALGKRRCDLEALGQADLRKGGLPAGYNRNLLHGLLTVVGLATLVTYLVYTLDPGTARRFGNPLLVLNVPLVAFCVRRFQKLVESGKVAGPTEVVTRDVPFILGLLAWAGWAFVTVTWGDELYVVLLRVLARGG